MTYARVVILLRLNLLEQCLNHVLRTSIKTCNFVTFYKFLIHLGVHHTHCNLCKKHGGAYTTHNTSDCCRFEKDGKEKSKFHAAKKGGKKADPVNQNFAQLTKKIKKLEKTLKKSGKKAQKHQYEDNHSDSK
jgi:hypothetical protein